LRHVLILECLEKQNYRSREVEYDALEGQLSLLMARLAFHRLTGPTVPSKRHILPCASPFNRPSWPPRRHIRSFKADNLVW